MNSMGGFAHEGSEEDGGMVDSGESIKKRGGPFVGHPPHLAPEIIEVEWTIIFLGFTCSGFGISIFRTPSLKSAFILFGIGG